LKRSVATAAFSWDSGCSGENQRHTPIVCGNLLLLGGGGWGGGGSHARLRGGACSSPPSWGRGRATHAHPRARARAPEVGRTTSGTVLVTEKMGETLGISCRMIKITVFSGHTPQDNLYLNPKSNRAPWERKCSHEPFVQPRFPIDPPWRPPPRTRGLETPPKGAATRGCAARPLRKKARPPKADGGRRGVRGSPCSGRKRQNQPREGRAPKCTAKKAEFGYGYKGLDNDFLLAGATQIEDRGPPRQWERMMNKSGGHQRRSRSVELGVIRRKRMTRPT